MKTYFFFSLLLFVSSSLVAQDIHFSQPYQAGPFTNPALTGMGQSNTKLSMVIRSQWGSLLGGNSFKTILASLEHRETVLQKDQIGLGFSLFSDRAGELNLQQNQANLSFSYSKRLVKSSYYHSHLLAGLYAGVGQRSINYDLARWGSQFNPGKQEIDPTKGAEAIEGMASDYLYTDAGAGLLWYIKGVKRNSGGGYFGAAMSHFVGTHREFRREQRNPLPVKYTIHAGAELPLGGQMCFLPTLVSYVQGAAFQANAGAALSFTLQKTNTIENELILGAWIRLGNNPVVGQIKPESFIPVARLKFNDWEAGLSYDFPLTALRSAAIGNGSLELSLNYSFNKYLDRRMKCPRLF